MPQSGRASGAGPNSGGRPQGRGDFFSQFEEVPNDKFFSQFEEEKPPEQGFLSRAWSAISDPLWTGPSEYARSVATDMTDPNNKPSWWTGFRAGAYEGIGDLLSSFTSPLSLATAGAGGLEVGAAKAGLPRIAQAMNTTTKALSAPVAAHGAMQFTDPNATWGERLMGVGEMAGGAAGMRHQVPSRARGAGPNVGAPRPVDVPVPAANVNPQLARQVVDPNLAGGAGDPMLAGSASVDDMIASLGLREGSPEMQVMDPNAGFANNASGESAASLEALNRQSSMKAKGQQFVVYDRAGNKKILMGPDAVDYAVRNGESYGIEGPNGFQLLDDKGGRYPQIKPEQAPSGSTTGNKPSAVIIKKPSPEVIKQVMQEGYVFDSIRDDGSFRMVKSDKPLNLPVLESEVAGRTARPTPANAARMGAGQPPLLPPPSARMGGAGPTPPNQPRSAVTQPRTARDTFIEAYNFPRAVMASMDFSAPLRQGLPLIHKKQFWTSLDDMFKAWGSERTYQAMHDDILSRPLFKERVTPGGKPLKSFAEESGLKLTDLNSLSTREENMMSSFAERIPGVRRSNRAYTMFLNKLRADTFEDLITRSKVFVADGNVNLPLARELANFVNTASGRGSLGQLEKSAVTLNTLLFSPRLIASRLTMLNPKYYISASPQVRKEALKSLFAVAAVGSTVTQLGKLAGGTVESDPASSDFGKLKIGNTRLDPYGGFQQYIVAANRLAQGRVTSSTSGREFDLGNPQKPFDPTYADILTRFARGKAHPTIGFVWSLLSGQKEMSGQKMDLTTTNPMENAIAQRFIPIMLQDLYQLAQEDPSLLPILGPLTGFGMSTQVYGNER